jgi:hemolysin activation/secretion protein
MPSPIQRISVRLRREGRPRPAPYRRILARTAAWLNALALAVLCAAPAGAQLIERPADRRPELPELERPGKEAPLVLPELPPLPEPEGGWLSSGLEVFVREFRIVGSTVFAPEELQVVVAPYTDRTLRSEDLAAVQRALTLLYVERGYVNSGAVLPDQDVSDGVVEVQVVEGSLASIEVSGERYFRASRLRERVALGVGVPLDVHAIEERLQLLQQDPRIESVHARLGPGERPGEARLTLEVEEASPYQALVEVANYEPPSIGAFAMRGEAAHENPLGFGDELVAEITLSEGLERYEGRYEIPLTARGALLSFDALYSDAGVVEEPFRQFASQFQSYGIGLHHPVYQSPETTVTLGVDGEWRQSYTTQATSQGRVPIDFDGTGSERGRSTATVLRFVAEALRRDGAQALAARSTLSVGLDALGGTVQGDGQPDGQFVAWLAQLQWVRRFEPWDIEVLARADLQLADDPLLALEQFALGGHESVRGYRENQLVSDEGVDASIELRIPVWSQARFGTRVSLAPFFDVGNGFSPARRRRTEAEGLLDDALSGTLVSSGIGLRLELTRFLYAELYWGRQLIESDTSGNLQDHGVQVAVRFDLARAAAELRQLRSGRKASLGK